MRDGNVVALEKLYQITSLDIIYMFACPIDSWRAVKMLQAHAMCVSKYGNFQLHFLSIESLFD